MADTVIVIADRWLAFSTFPYLINWHGLKSPSLVRQVNWYSGIADKIVFLWRTFSSQGESLEAFLITWRFGSEILISTWLK